MHESKLDLHFCNRSVSFVTVRKKATELTQSLRTNTVSVKIFKSSIDEYRRILVGGVGNRANKENR